MVCCDVEWGLGSREFATAGREKCGRQQRHLRRIMCDAPQVSNPRIILLNTVLNTVNSIILIRGPTQFTEMQ